MSVGAITGCFLHPDHIAVCSWNCRHDMTTGMLVCVTGYDSGTGDASPSNYLAIYILFVYVLWVCTGLYAHAVLEECILVQEKRRQTDIRSHL